MNVALSPFLSALLLLLRSNAPRVKVAAVELLIARACEDPSLLTLSCAEIHQRPGERERERENAVERERKRKDAHRSRLQRFSTLGSVLCVNSAKAR